MNAYAQIRFHLQCFAWQLKLGQWKRIGFHLEGLVRGLYALLSAQDK